MGQQPKPPLSSPPFSPLVSLAPCPWAELRAAGGRQWMGSQAPQPEGETSADGHLRLLFLNRRRDTRRHTSPVSSCSFQRRLKRKYKPNTCSFCQPAPDAGPGSFVKCKAPSFGPTGPETAVPSGWHCRPPPAGLALREGYTVLTSPPAAVDPICVFPVIIDSGSTAPRVTRVTALQG